MSNKAFVGSTRRTSTTRIQGIRGAAVVWSAAGVCVIAWVMYGLPWEAAALIAGVAASTWVRGSTAGMGPR